MQVRTGLLVIAVLLAVVPGWSQSQRLGDVAGTIKLDRKALTEGDGGTVLDPRLSRKADRELLGGLLEDCATRARQLADLIVEARSTIMYRDDQLSNRLQAASLDLAAAVQEIYSLRLSEPFAEPLDVARDAAAVCDTAAESTKEEIQRLGVAFTEATELTASCRLKLEEASILLSGRSMPAAAGGGPATPEPGSEAEQTAIDVRVAELCRPERSGGQDAWQHCLDRQYQALAAIQARSATNEMLPEGVFQGVRKDCRLRHPDDYAAIDLCEQERMTETRLELEAKAAAEAEPE
jgi:hypothetical protein